jgi:hypothetical protein
LPDRIDVQKVPVGECRREYHRSRFIEPCGPPQHLEAKHLEEAGVGVERVRLHPNACVPLHLVVTRLDADGGLHLRVALLQGWGEGRGRERDRGVEALGIPRPQHAVRAVGVRVEVVVGELIGHPEADQDHARESHGQADHVEGREARPAPERTPGDREIIP